MYLKLGTTNIKYSTDQDDFIIFSEIIDSTMSYEKPILVRTPDELDIWFGKSFTNRDYLIELLKSGVTLFLYKPIKTEQNKNSENYIDIEKYSIDKRLYYNISELPKEGENEVLYKVIESSGDYKDNDIYFSYYIYFLGSYVKTTELPQNLDSNNTDSLNNRDVLNINFTGFKGPEYCYPKYIENEAGEILDYQEKINKEILLDNLPDLTRISKGYDTLGYTLKFSDNIDFHPTNQGLTSKYIVLEKLQKKKVWLKKDIIPTRKDYYNHKNILIWFKEKESDNNIPNIPSQYYTDVIKVEINKDQENKEIFKKLVEEIIPGNLEYIVEGNISNEYRLYTSYPTRVTHFTNITDLELNPDFNTTHNILSKVSIGGTRIRFISKTIGTEFNDSNYLDSNIKIVIEDLGKKDNYRVTIERYNYQEVFEGGIFILNSDRLDSMITKESKLVSCIVQSSYINQDTGEKLEYKIEDKNSRLPSGEWYLKRAEIEENITPKEYWKSIDSIFNSDNSGKVDYLLIPNIYNYTTGMKSGSDTNYYPEYRRFLDYAELYNFQVLIQNSDNGWNYVKTDHLPTKGNEHTIYIYRDKFYKPDSAGNLVETIDPEETNTYGNNYIFNYTSDKDNRLLYFYRPIEVFGFDRPGYYLHIKGLLQNIYSMSSDQIRYNTPTKNPYVLENIEEKLETYKSNYLVFNNQMYYYKKYQNGQDFNTSGWMRFCIGKVSRELEKNKWKILGTKWASEIRTRIEQILDSITLRFSFIDSLRITGFYLDLQNNRLGLEIESKMSDLVDNNINIDIILNYNKK